MPLRAEGESKGRAFLGGVLSGPMFPNIPMSVRNVAKWIALIGLILSGLFTVLGFISHRNGKKSVLKKIDLYEEK